MTEARTNLRILDVLDLHPRSDSSPPVVTPTVKLADLVFSLETQADTDNCFLDRQTGQVHLLTEDDAMLAADGGDARIPEWQVSAVEIARAIAAGPDRFLHLPTRLDVEELAIMARFCDELSDEAQRDELRSALRSSGAPQRFRGAIRQLDLRDAWERHYVHALERIAIDWCDRHGVVYEAAELPWLAATGEDAEAIEQRSAAANAERLLHEPVYTHATWRAHPDRCDDFLATWNELGDLFERLAHPPIEVTLIRSVNDPSVFQSIGSWRSLSDAQAVSDSAEAIDVLARLAECCADGAPEVYEVVRRVRPS